MTLWRKITAKSWEHAGETEGLHGGVTITQPSKRVALRVFLAVIASVFFLLLVAYRIRMAYPDWQPLPLPSVLWVNTVLLVLASIAMQWTRSQAGLGRDVQLRLGMIVSGVLTVAFIAGQLLAWSKLLDAGHGLRGNPASAFFYLLTAVHGLHIVGGLWVWLRATGRAFGEKGAAAVTLSVQLCATYWHFLLLVWLIMFYFLLTT
jgi:cytochrome c oxidase subunit 3